MGHLYQMSVEFIQSMTLGSICPNSLPGQEGWCKVHSVGRTELGFSVVQWAAAGGWCVMVPVVKGGN